MASVDGIICFICFFYLFTCFRIFSANFETHDCWLLMATVPKEQGITENLSASKRKNTKKVKTNMYGKNMQKHNMEPTFQIYFWGERKFVRSQHLWSQGLVMFKQASGLNSSPPWTILKVRLVLQTNSRIDRGPVIASHYCLQGKN